MLLWESFIRLLAAVVIGGIIGLERKKHGISAGIRMHMLVCIGSVLAVLVSLYAASCMPEYEADIFRIAAQIIPGIGFLGAGMILLRGEMIMGLTTAAGVWATAIIGIALGYGFYAGALIAAGLMLIVNTVVARLEKREISFVTYYAETDDINSVNRIIKEIDLAVSEVVICRTLEAKSHIAGNLGIEIVTENARSEDISLILEIKGVLYASKE